MNSGSECSLPDKNPGSDDIKTLLEKSKTVAIVGLSGNRDRDSHHVGKYLQKHGYRVIPVNPASKEILGEKCYPDLLSVPERIDIVDVFRKPEALPGIVDEAIKVGAGAVWMQIGLSHEEAAGRARCAGLTVVQSKCIKAEHARHFDT